MAYLRLLKNLRNIFFMARQPGLFSVCASSVISDGLTISISAITEAQMTHPPLQPLSLKTFLPLRNQGRVLKSRGKRLKGRQVKAGSARIREGEVHDS
jgi:hypothetical protein